MFNLYICQLRLQLAKVHMIVTHDFLSNERREEKKNEISSIDRSFEFHFSFHKLNLPNTHSKQSNKLAAGLFSFVYIDTFNSEQSTVNSHFKCILSIFITFISNHWVCWFLIKTWIIRILPFTVYKRLFNESYIETWWSFVIQIIRFWLFIRFHFVDNG